MPDGFRIASAYVVVTLDQDQLDRDLADLETKLEAIRDLPIRATVDQKWLTSQVAWMQAKLDSLKTKDLTEGAIDQDAINASIGEIKEKLEEISEEGIRLTIDQDALDESIGLAREKLEALAASVPVKFDVSQASLATVLAKAKAFYAANPVSLNVNVAALGAAATMVSGFSRRLTNLTTKTVYATMALAALDSELDRKREALAGTAFDAGALGAVLAALAAKTRDNAAATRQAAGAYAGWWSWLNRPIPLFAGALPGFLGHISAWHLALDSLIEVFIAVGTAAAALTTGLLAMYPAADEVHDHLTSVYDVSQALNTSIPPLSGKFDKLAQSMGPSVIEAYGGAINLMNQGLNNSGNILQKVASEVSGGIDNIVARVDLWAKSQSSLGFILQTGVGFLHQWTQVAGALALALDNLVKADPGTAHYLMDLVVGASRLIEEITKLPQPILFAALAIHSFWLWGGLLATGLSKLLIPVRALGVALGGLKTTAVADLADDATPLERLKATFTDIAGGFAAYGSNIKTAATESQGLARVTSTLDAATGGLLSKLMTIAASPWTWVAVAVAAFAAVAYQSSQASTSVKNFIGQINARIGADSASQAIIGISVAIGQLNDKIKETNVSSELQGMGLWQKTADQLRVSVGDLYQGFTHLGSGMSAVKDIWGGVSSLWNASGAAALQASRDTAAYRGEIIQLSAQQKNLLGVVGSLMQGQTRQISQTNALVHVYGGVTESVRTGAYTYSEALELMDLAGVKAGDSFSLMKQKVDNLIQGFKDMSVQGGLLANSVAAITFQTAQGDSKITALTGAWSNFISVVTGGEQSFSTFEQQMAGITTAATTAANSLTVANGKTSVSTKGAGTAAAAAAVQIDGLSSASLQLRSSFSSGITDASQLMNSLLTMASAAGLGAKGTALLTQAGKDMVAQLLPMAKGSSEATAQLYALAQQGGYTGADSFQALTKWVGKTGDAEKNLSGITGTLTKASADLATDVQNLADDISQNLNNAMAMAVFQASGGQKALTQFGKAVLANKDNLQADVPAATTLAQMLLTLTGNTAQAHQEFDALAIKLHLTTQQANDLWNMINQGIPARGNLRSNVEWMISNVPGAYKALEQYTTDIRKNTTDTAAGKATRAALIADIELAGQKAGWTNGQMATMISTILKIPKSEAFQLLMTGKGTYTIAQEGWALTHPAGSKPPSPLINPAGGPAPGIAAGGLVHGEGGPTEDKVPAWLSAGEYVMRASSVDKYGKYLFDALNSQRFAAGGFVETGTPGVFTGQYAATTMTGAFQTSMTNALVGAMRAALHSAEVQAASGTGGYAGPGGGTRAQNEALARSLFPFPASQWQDFVNVVMAESGFNQFASNPSGAYGIAQALPASKYPLAGRPASEGGSSNPTAQLTWMFDYIRCMPLDAEILTRNGWKRYDQIVAGDETIGYNMATGRSEWTPVTHISAYDDAPLVRLRNKTWTAICTPNHRWMSSHIYQAPNPDSGPGVPASVSWRADEFVETSRITSRHSIRLAAETDTGDGPPISDGEAELLGWVMGDGSVQSYAGRRQVDSEMGRQVLRIAGENPGLSIRGVARLAGCTHQTAGAYMRSGGAVMTSAHPRTGTGSMTRVSVYQSRPEGVRVIESLLAQEGLPYTRHNCGPNELANRQCMVWRLRASCSADLLERSGYDHLNPVPFVLSLSESQRSAFLRGLEGAEGHQEADGEMNGYPTKGGMQLSQGDGAQQDALILALYLSGKRLGTSEWSQASRETLGSRTGANIRGSHPFAKGSMIRQEDAGRGPAWCPTTTLGTWTARLGRQVFLTGNSRYGTPAAAWAHESEFHWYDRGGQLMPGVTTAVNTTGRPETVLPNAGGVTVNFFGTTMPTPEQTQAFTLALTSAIANA